MITVDPSCARLLDDAREQMANIIKECKDILNKPNPFQQLAEPLIIPRDGWLLIPASYFKRFPELEPYRQTPGVKVLDSINCAYILDSRKIPWATFAPPVL